MQGSLEAALGNTTLSFDLQSFAHYVTSKAGGFSYHLDETLNLVGAEHNEDNETLTPSEPVTIKRIMSNGTGCPIGTTAQNMAEDKTSFTLTFSAFTAEFGSQLSPEAARKNCVLTLTLFVPAGWQYFIGSFYYRGFMGLEPGCMIRPGICLVVEAIRIKRKNIREKFLEVVNIHMECKG